MNENEIFEVRENDSSWERSLANKIITIERTRIRKRNTIISITSIGFVLFLSFAVFQEDLSEYSIIEPSEETEIQIVIEENSWF